MRCLFSMFAEDVDLIPRESVTELLRKLRGHPGHAQSSLQGLWETMNSGGFSQALMQDLKRFNGGLFKEADALHVQHVVFQQKQPKTIMRSKRATADAMS